jgi:hypothetical protein
MRRNFKLILVFIALSLVAAPAHARQDTEERLSSLLEGRVTFTLPAAWVVQRHVNTPSNGRAQLGIPYPAADKTPHSVNAVLIANTVPEGVTVRHLSDGVYKNGFEGLQVLSDEFDGDDWRTMVWTARSNGASYVMLHRFGLTGRTSVELMAAFPLLEGGDPKWVEKAVADFNALAASLKIDGRNRVAAVVKLDKIPQPQKVNPKP